jgi:hypothetical protein
MTKTKTKGAARGGVSRVNPLLPHGVPTAAEVDEFLDVVAFCFSRALVSPGLLRLMQLSEQAKQTFARA